MVVRLTVAICMTSWLCCDVALGSSAPYKWEVVQGLAQSSDLVITGTILDVQRGTRGGVQPDRSYSSSTDTRVKCAVKSVHIGNTNMAGRTVTILFTAADSPIRKGGNAPVLLFLKREQESYRLPFSGKYGVFQLDGENVRCWLEGKPRGKFFTLKELLLRVTGYQERNVAILVDVQQPVMLVESNLNIVYTFRNSGALPVYIIPPSHCFNSIQCRKLSNGQWFPDENPWRSVMHWDFLSVREQLFQLPENSTRVLKYSIPFSTLGIDAEATYRITSCYRQYRHLQWHTSKTQTVAHAEVWLGVPDVKKWELSIGATTSAEDEKTAYYQP
jgi:hypothetical protein